MELTIDIRIYCVGYYVIFYNKYGILSLPSANTWCQFFVL